MPLPKKVIVIKGFRIIGERLNDGCFNNAYGLDDDALNPFLKKHLDSLPKTDNDAALKKILENAVNEYNLSLK